MYLKGQVWFSTGPNPRKVANTVFNSAVVINTEDAKHPVIVEGEAIEVIEHSDIAAFAEAMDALDLPKQVGNSA